MASVRSKVIRYFSSLYMKGISPDRDVHKLRKGLESRTSILPTARGVRIRKAKIDAIDCEWHIPDGCDDAPIILYLHGGAFVMGSPATHRRLVSYIARAAGMRALVPDYRLAPEHQFPAALDDSLTIYRHLLNRYSDTKIVIGGDSAGGNLAAATTLAIRDAGEKIPTACFLMSPWLDMTAAGESLQTRATKDPWFKPEHVAPLAAKVFPESEIRNPLVSPVFADAANLPPMLIHVGDHEILLSDTTRLVENIRQAGGDVELRVWDGMWHVFQFFVGQMPESNQSIGEIGNYLQSKIADVVANTRAA